MQEFLAAGEEGILSHVEQIMMASAERLDFEEAEFYKRRLIELRRVLGTGERPTASISSNDFVILNPLLLKEGAGGGSAQCEVMFVRFGRLVKQAIVSRAQFESLRPWAERQVRHYYGATSAIPPTAGKPEIDEMRILMRWVEENKKKGSRVVYIDPELESSSEQIVQELKELFMPKSTIVPLPVQPKRERRLILKPMKPA